MIRIPDTPLDPATDAALRRFQTDLDALPDYADRVAEAEKKFASRNREGNKTFRVVRGTLVALCSEWCMYCEVSLADEVEHVRPKQLYPGFTFVWENYVYACGPCNVGKRSRFEIHEDVTGVRRDVTRRLGDPIIEPRAGTPLFIDPRTEDPMDFLRLDLSGTFWFVPVGSLSSQDRERAEFTLELLKLNAKASLVSARRCAYSSLLAHLRDYAETRRKTPRSPKLKRTVESVRECSHRTVWEEMKRQRSKLNELRELFKAVPEALGW